MVKLISFTNSKIECVWRERDSERNLVFYAQSECVCACACACVRACVRQYTHHHDVNRLKIQH